MANQERRRGIGACMPWVDQRVLLPFPGGWRQPLRVVKLEVLHIRGSPESILGKILYAAGTRRPRIGMDATGLQREVEDRSSVSKNGDEEAGQNPDPVGAITHRTTRKTLVARGSPESQLILQSIQSALSMEI